MNADRDLDELLTELALTDLSTVEKRLESTHRKAKSGDKKLAEEIDFLKRLREHLSEGQLASELTYSSTEEAILRELFLLTLKPRLYVVNVGEDALAEAGALLEAGSGAEGRDGRAEPVSRRCGRGPARG